MINLEATKGARKIRNGLEEDIDALAEEFKRANSVRFADFSRLWKTNSFSFIFTYKLNESDLREFIEEAYLLVLRQLSRPMEAEQTIFVLYLLYCIFISQPTEPKIPIKINHSKYKTFSSLFHESHNNKHLDVCYVWMKLWSLGAINLVAHAETHGPLAIRKNPSQSGSSSTNFNANTFQEFENEMDELKKLHETYLELAERLEGPEGAEIKEMMLVRDDLFSEFSQILEKSSDEEVK